MDTEDDAIYSRNGASHDSSFERGSADRKNLIGQPRRCEIRARQTKLAKDGEGRTDDTKG